MDDPAFLSPPFDTIAETALGVINGRKNTRQAQANTSSLYQEGDNPLSEEGRNEILEFEPAYTVVSAEEFEEDRQDKKVEVECLTALNGLPANDEKQVEQITAFAGFVRSETANEHMKDNANGAFALKVHGVFTTIHTGITDIRGGGLVRIRALTPEEAKLQKIVGRRQNKVLLATEEYRPELDAVDKKNAFVSLMMQLGERFETRERDITSFQAEIYADWWKAKRIQFAIFSAEQTYMREKKRMSNKAAFDAALIEFRNSARELGLVPGDAGDVDFQRSLIKRLFTMNTFTGIAQPDVSLTYYSSPRNANAAQGLTMSEFSTRNELYMLQVSAIENEQNAIISGHAKVMNSIIGRAPNGAKAGKKLDLVMWKI